MGVMEKRCTSCKKKNSKKAGWVPKFGGDLRRGDKRVGGKKKKCLGGEKKHWLKVGV